MTATRTHSFDHLARPALVTLFAILAAIVLTGCSGPGRAASDAPASPAPAPSVAVFDDPGALVAAVADVDGATVRVSGFLVATPDGAQLCGIVLESYPPQCGGPTLTVTGQVPQDVLDALDTTSEPDLARAWWGWVWVTGTVAAGSGGTPSIAISSIEVDDSGA